MATTTTTLDIIDHYREYNQSDNTYNTPDASGTFDWAIPAKYIHALRNGSRHHLPEYMPFPVPQARPHSLNPYGWEPGHVQHPDMHTMLQQPTTTWAHHECHILWAMVRGRQFHLKKHRKHPDKYKHSHMARQIDSYVARTNPYQLLSKVHRLGQLMKDLRLCDYYVTMAVAPVVKNGGVFRNQNDMPPPDKDLAMYLWHNSASDTIANANLRAALIFLYATTFAAHLCKGQVVGDLLDPRLRDKVTHRCGLHCHPPALKDECKHHTLHRYYRE